MNKFVVLLSIAIAFGYLEHRATVRASQFLLEPLPSRVLLFDATSRLALNFTEAGYEQDDYTNVVQELSIIYNTSVPNALLYYYEDSGFVLAFHCSSADLAIYSFDKVSGNASSVRLNVSLVPGLDSCSCGYDIQLEVSCRNGLVTVFAGSRRWGVLQLPNTTFLFGSGSMQFGNAQVDDDRVVGVFGAFVGELAVLRLRSGDEEPLDVAQVVYDEQDLQGLQVLNVQKTVMHSEDPDELKQAILQGTQYSVTFFGEPNSVVRVSDRFGGPKYWDFDILPGSSSTIDFQFLTFDPIGILLFKGAQIDSYAYVCMEMFDGKLFLRFNTGVRQNHHTVKLCGGRILNDGQPHTVVLTVARSEGDQSVSLYVSCDDQLHSVEEERFVNALDGYLYVAGVDSLDRLPWHVWSRRDFHGALKYFRLNDQYVDFHEYFSHKVRVADEPAVASRLEVTDTCNPVGHEANGVCAQQLGGICWVDRHDITAGHGYFCDCSSLPREALRCGPDYYESAFGTSRSGSWALKLVPTWVTHCDDIMISFRLLNFTDVLVSGEHGMHDQQRRRRRDTGSADERYLRAASGPVLFAISNEGHYKFIVARVKGDSLELEIMLEDDMTALPIVIPIALDPNYPSTEWYSLKIRRRANFMIIYLNGVTQSDLTLPGDGFEMETAHIHAGCLPGTEDFLCNNLTIFQGEVRNFVINRFDVLNALNSKAAYWGSTGHVISVYRATEFVVNIYRKVLYYSYEQWQIDSGALSGSFNSQNDTSRLKYNRTAISGGKPLNETITIPTVAPERYPMSNVIGLMGHQMSMVELPASKYIQEDDEKMFIGFQFAAETLSCLVFYMRGRSESDEQTSFITLEVYRGKLRMQAQFVGDFIGTNAEYPVRKVFKFFYDFDAVRVQLHEIKHVTLMLSKETFTTNIDGNSESFYFISDQSASDEFSLSRLPQDLLSGTIFLGGMPWETWSEDYMLNRTVNRQRYLRGCIGMLTVRTVLVTYNQVVAVHRSIGADWQISSTCESMTHVTCEDLQCSPFSKCVEQRADQDAYCECTGSGFGGEDCDQTPEFGYYCGKSGLQAGLYLLSGYGKPGASAVDDIVLGVLTRYTEGILLRIDQLVGELVYLQVRLFGGRLLLDYYNQRRKTNVTLDFPEDIDISSGTYSVLRLTRNDSWLILSVYNRDSYYEREPIKLIGLEGFSYGRFRLTLCGSAASPGRYFNGIVSGLTWNKQDVFEHARANASRKRELRGDVVEVYAPYRLFPWPCYGLFSLAPCPTLNTASTARVKTSTLATGLGHAGLGGELDVYLPLAVEAAAAEAAPVATSVPTAALALASAVLLLVAVAGSLIVSAVAGCSAPPPAAAAVPAEAVPLAAGDIGVSGGNSVRALPPAAGDDIPLTGNPNVRSAPPAAVGVSGAVGVAQGAMVPFAYPVPVPVPVPYAVPYAMPMSYGFMPTPYPYLVNQPVMALQSNESLAAIPHHAQSSALRISELDSTSTLDARKRHGSSATATAARQEEMRFGGTETIFEKTTLQERAPLHSARSRSVSASLPGLLELGDEYKVQCFVLTSDSEHVVTGSSIGSPCYWSLNSGEAVRTMQDAAEDDYYVCANELHLACDDTLLVGQVSADVSLLTSQVALNVPSHYRKLQIWRAADGSAVSTPCFLYCTTSCLMNNKQIVLAAAVDDNSTMNICLWNLVHNEPLAQFQTPVAVGNAIGDALVRTVRMSTDDSCCVAAVTLTTEPSPTSYFVVQLRGAEQQSARSITFDCEHDCFVPVAGLRCVTGTRRGEMLLWSTQTTSVICNLLADSDSDSDSHGPVTCLAASRNALLLASGDSLGIVKLWRFDDNRVAPDLLHSLNAHGGRVSCLAFSNDNEFLLTGSADGAIRLWRSADGVQTSWFTSNVNILSVQMTENKRAIVALGEKDQRRKFMMLRIVRNVVTRKTVEEA